MFKTIPDYPKKSCSACGTSPINHKLLFVISALDETLGRIDKLFLKITLKDSWQKVARIVEKSLFFIFSIFRVVTFNQDPEKSLTGRSKLIWQEAINLGIKMEQIVIFGKPIEYYRAKINNTFFYFQSLPIPDTIPQEGYRWVDDKFTLADKLTFAGIPSPKTTRVYNLHKAKEAFGRMRKPVILKPTFGSRGRHTTTNINTVAELEAAYKLARKITTSMVLQEHLFGSVYRATVIQNKLVGFFRADPPQVIGDGIKTISTLILEKNFSRQERISEISINEDLKDFIKRKGYTLESVLPSDEILDLSAKTGRLYGSYTKEMLEEVHPKIHEIFNRAAILCKAPVLGFDLIIEDPTKDPATQRFGIIECNSLPFIDLHYFALEGTPKNLAKNVWDLWPANKFPN